MPKTGSPLRLDIDFTARARRAAEAQNRSIANQIEYWADIGRHVSNDLSTKDLELIRSGLATVKVEYASVPPVDSDSIFQAVEQARESGELARSFSTAKYRYQASRTHPGYLERIDADFNIEVGEFKNGQFHPLESPE